MGNKKFECVISEGQKYKWIFTSSEKGDVEIKGNYDGKDENRILLTPKAAKALKIMMESYDE